MNPTQDPINTECPDPASHQQDVAERLFPGVRLLSWEQCDIVDTQAEAEYLNCEGHR